MNKCIYKAKIIYHNANSTSTIELDCLSWSRNNTTNTIEIYDGSNVHYIPLASTVYVSLPAKAKEALICIQHESTNENLWVESADAFRYTDADYKKRDAIFNELKKKYEENKCN